MCLTHTYTAAHTRTQLHARTQLHTHVHSRTRRRGTAPCRPPPAHHIVPPPASPTATSQLRSSQCCLPFFSPHGARAPPAATHMQPEPCTTITAIPMESHPNTPGCPLSQPPDAQRTGLHAGATCHTKTPHASPPPPTPQVKDTVTAAGTADARAACAPSVAGGCRPAGMLAPQKACPAAIQEEGRPAAPKPVSFLMPLVPRHMHCCLRGRHTAGPARLPAPPPPPQPCLGCCYRADTAAAQLLPAAGRSAGQAAATVTDKAAGFSKPGPGLAVATPPPQAPGTSGALPHVALCSSHDDVTTACSRQKVTEVRCMHAAGAGQGGRPTGQPPAAAG